MRFFFYVHLPKVPFVRNAQAVSEQAVGVSAFIRRKHMVSDYLLTLLTPLLTPHDPPPPRCMQWNPSCKSTLKIEQEGHKKGKVFVQGFIYLEIHA